MKIYTTNNTETDSVEILLDYQELKKLVNSLKKFEDEVNQFKMKNKDAEGLGFTHLHLKDCGLIDKNSKSDVIFYPKFKQIIICQQASPFGKKQLVWTIPIS